MPDSHAPQLPHEQIPLPLSRADNRIPMHHTPQPTITHNRRNEDQ
jgi:hypothetical protein